MKTRSRSMVQVIHTTVLNQSIKSINKINQLKQSINQSINQSIKTINKNNQLKQSIKSRLTLASHSMPMIAMARSMVQVITPTILMSCSSLIIRASFTCNYI